MNFYDVANSSTGIFLGESTCSYMLIVKMYKSGPFYFRAKY